MATLEAEVKAAIAQYIEGRCPEKPDDPELTEWERSLVQPRVFVDVGTRGYHHIIKRRPFLKKWKGKGEWCIRCCGTAALTKPHTDKHGTIIFNATYADEPSP